MTLGPPSGYVIRFTNGLTVYLSGDTGMHAEMKSIVADYYKANLMVLNLGPSALTSKEAAYVADELVHPASVIASHVNEGATTGARSSRRRGLRRSCRSSRDGPFILR